MFNDVKNIIKIQLELIYMDDSKIDTSEALHKVDLQEVFDLSYDTFLEISNHFDLLRAFGMSVPWQLPLQTETKLFR